MTRATPADNSLKRELRRLDAAQLEAQRDGDTLCLAHTRLLWCELILTRCPWWAPKLGARIAYLLPGAFPAIPRWKLELRCRPLVPIVRRTLTTSKLPSGGISRGAWETLACGHIHRMIVVFDSDLRARRRRCKQCGAALLAAIDGREKALAQQKVRHGNR